MPEQVLFTAPSDFLTTLPPTAEGLEVRFQEVWTAGALPDDNGFSYWIVNPGQHFIVDAGVLDRYSALQAVVTPSTGTNHIDAGACRAAGVEMLSLLDDRRSLDSICASAEFTFLHVLNTLRRIDVGYSKVSAGQWRDDERCLRGHELSGRRIGLLGYGRIGRRLAKYCRAFECTVSAFDPHVEIDGRVRAVGSLEELFNTNDIVIICCALTTETRELVGADLVRLLPADAILVNTARGEILNEEEVLGTLQHRPDLTVAVDVVNGEVAGTHLDSGLVAAHGRGTVLVTPHIAGATVESQYKAAHAAFGLVSRHVMQS